MLTLDQLGDIQQAFAQIYMFPIKWHDYVRFCSVTQIGILDRNASDEEKNNFCLRVGILKPLPPDMSIPSEYQGLRIFVEIIKEIKPL